MSPRQRRRLWIVSVVLLFLVAAGVVGCMAWRAGGPDGETPTVPIVPPSATTTPTVSPATDVVATGPGVPAPPRTEFVDCSRCEAGVDVARGNYATEGPEPGRTCGWWRLNLQSDEVGGVIDSDKVTGPAKLVIGRNDDAVTTTGGCRWVLVV
jgi:hypothetical protein